MSIFLFIGSMVWGALAAQFLVQAISSFISACIFLYGLLFSRVKKKLNAIFFSSALTQAAVFAALLVAWVGLLVRLWERKLDHRISGFRSQFYLFRHSSTQ
jgi:hypothetical protein